MLLKDKNIIVAVTGSIAIYKSLELVRLYIKAGANVRVIMTQSARRFITPLTFEAISQNRVLCEDSEDWDKNQFIIILIWENGLMLLLLLLVLQIL